MSERVVRAARAFEHRLSDVQASIDNAFLIAAVHSCPYHGPTYRDELIELRAALDEAERGEP